MSAPLPPKVNVYGARETLCQDVAHRFDVVAKLVL